MKPGNGGQRPGKAADTPPRPPGQAAEVFRAFLKLGLTSFGGPVAHLGYFRDEFVTRRGWMTEAEYADLVALCQFLPGPASSQLGFAIGLMRAGWGGALAGRRWPLPPDRDRRCRTDFHATASPRLQDDVRMGCYPPSQPLPPPAQPGPRPCPLTFRPTAV